jgi:hypothetical protein
MIMIFLSADDAIATFLDSVGVSLGERVSGDFKVTGIIFASFELLSVVFAVLSSGEGDLDEVADDAEENDSNDGHIPELPSLKGQFGNCEAETKIYFYYSTERSKSQ